MDYLFFTLHLSGISSVIGSVNFLVSVLSRQSFNALLDWYYLYLSLFLYL